MKFKTEVVLVVSILSIFIQSFQLVLAQGDSDQTSTTWSSSASSEEDQDDMECEFYTSSTCDRDPFKNAINFNKIRIPHEILSNFFDPNTGLFRNIESLVIGSNQFNENFIRILPSTIKNLRISGRVYDNSLPLLNHFIVLNRCEIEEFVESGNEQVEQKERLAMEKEEFEQRKIDQLILETGFSEGELEPHMFPFQQTIPLSEVPYLWLKSIATYFKSQPSN